jgi:anti-anti-sigma factor
VIAQSRLVRIDQPILEENFMTQPISALSRENDTWTMNLSGIIDTDSPDSGFSDQNAPLLKELVQANAKRLLIDLTATESIDSHGLKLLLNAQKEFARRNVQIVLQNPNPHLRRLFRIMQFDRLFVIESNP